MSEIDRHTKAPWAIYDPCDRLVYVGIHANHIAAWAGYFKDAEGKAVPFHAITNKVNDGWQARRVTVEPITNVIPLRLGNPIERDVMDVGQMMAIETGG